MKAVLQKSGGGVGGRRQRNDFIFRTRRRRIRWKKRVVRQNQSSGPPKAIRTFWVAIQSTIKPIKAHVLSAWSFPNSNVPCVHVQVQNCERILSYPQFLTCQWLSITLHHRPYLSVTQRHRNAPENLLWASAEFWPAKLLWTSAEFWQQTQESRQKQFRHSIQTVRNMDNVAVRQHGENLFTNITKTRSTHSSIVSTCVHPKVPAKHLTQNVHPRHSAKLPTMNRTNCFRKNWPQNHYCILNSRTYAGVRSCFTEAVTHRSYSAWDLNFHQLLKRFR